MCKEVVSVHAMRYNSIHSERRDLMEVSAERLALAALSLGKNSCIH